MNTKEIVIEVNVFRGSFENRVARLLLMTNENEDNFDTLIGRIRAIANHLEALQNNQDVSDLIADDMEKSGVFVKNNEKDS